MNVVVLSETKPEENRVALTPSSVRELAKIGCDITVVSGAGKSSHITDEEYKEEGADITVDQDTALQKAKVVLKVQAPTTEEVQALPKGVVLISLLSPTTETEIIKKLGEAGVTSFALELIPRITRAQSMDVLSSQATVAGYKAVLMGANELSKFMPMFMTAAGTIRPCKVLILGAGVAGLQAIATARRLGAKVEAFDVRPEVKEQIESLGASFLETEHEVTAEGEGGYASELSKDQHQQELNLIADHISDADLVVTTAQIPGRPAPELITETMVSSMRPGSVIVDLAATSGGNCSLTHEGTTIVHNGVKIIGPSNLPSTIPVHASQMFSKNVTTLLKELVTDGEISLDFNDEVVTSTCVTHAGEIINNHIKEKLEIL